jgi:hypothetical protein
VRTVALVLPGRSTGRSSPVAAMEGFVQATLERKDPDEVVIVEAADAQKEMDPILQRERRRARAAGVG